MTSTVPKPTRPRWYIMVPQSGRPRFHDVLRFTRYAPGYLSWMYERLSNVLKKSKDSPVTSEYTESNMPPAAVTLKAWHLLDLSDMTFGYMDVENDPLVPKEQRYWAVVFLFVNYFMFPYHINGHFRILDWCKGISPQNMALYGTVPPF